MWIEKTKDGKYKLREQYKNPLTGRYNKVSLTLDKNTNATRRKAQMLLEKKIQDKLVHVQDGNIKKGVTLGQVIDEWEPIYKKRVRLATWQTYVVAKKHIEKYIGLDTQVDKITPKLLINAYEDMLYKDDFNNPTVHMVEFKMTSILKYAFRKDYIRHQPIKSLDINWKQANHSSIENKYLDQDELEKVLAKVDEYNHYYKLIFEWQYFTGMRIGEVLATQLKDIKKRGKNYFVNINGTLAYTGRNVADYYKQDTPKTDAGFRTIKLPQRAIEIYQELKPGKTRSDFLFKYSDKWFAFTRLNACLRTAKKELNLKKQLTTHTFRHTHVSKLAELGMPLYIIQDRVGHKDAATTRDVYLHVTQNARTKYENLLDKL